MNDENEKDSEKEIKSDTQQRGSGYTHALVCIKREIEGGVLRGACVCGGGSERERERERERGCERESEAEYQEMRSWRYPCDPSHRFQPICSRAVSHEKV
jgi:hypothetical protein